MGKTQVVYKKVNPLEANWVNYIAIQTKEKVPYVFETYGGFRGEEDVPESIRRAKGMLVVSKHQAKKLFNFKKVKDLSVCLA